MKSIETEFGANPTINSSGKPRMMAVELPVTRLVAAGVLKFGSISLSSITPVLTVPVNIPYIEKKPSTGYSG